MMYWRTIRKLA